MRRILERIAVQSDEHEFYTPIPAGYRAGRTKYIIVTGSVMSGLGKGIFSSSLARVLQERGLRCTMLKFDGYLNEDAGTLNPFRHGEVFVLNDGTECDMDLGNYERFLNQDMDRDNYLTGGKIFRQILEKERKGTYLGRDVQFIPHVTGEIKGHIRTLGMKKRADIVIVEVGGTVGDIENSYFIEAMRELAYEEGQNNFCFINVTYIVELGSAGEQKSKPAQLGIRHLMSTGIQPNIIVCRSAKPVSEKIREKVSIYSNVPLNRVIGLEDLKSVYYVPLRLKGSGVDNEILEILHIKRKVSDSSWKGYLENLEKAEKDVTVAVAGKYTKVRDSYASIVNALEHAGSALRTRVNVRWIETSELKNMKDVKAATQGIDGLIVPGGFGRRGMDGKIMCINYSRTKNIPFLGLCLGFQMAVIEFARNACSLKHANSTEVEKTENPVIDLLPGQRDIKGLGGNMRLGRKEVMIKEGSLAYKLYGRRKIEERFRHRYECNPKYVDQLTCKGMVFSGESPEGLKQILEILGHRFFLATQFHPCYMSRPLRPHPLFIGFLRACLKK